MCQCDNLHSTNVLPPWYLDTQFPGCGMVNNACGKHIKGKVKIQLIHNPSVSYSLAQHAKFGPYKSCTYCLYTCILMQTYPLTVSDGPHRVGLVNTYYWNVTVPHPLVLMNIKFLHLCSVSWFSFFWVKCRCPILPRNHTKKFCMVLITIIVLWPNINELKEKILLQ